LDGTVTRAALTVAQIRALISDLGDISAKLAEARPTLKVELYAELGLRLTYQPNERRVLVEASPPCAQSRVGGGFHPQNTPTLVGVLDLAARKLR
jgi:hypothetical protein